MAHSASRKRETGLSFNLKYKKAGPDVSSGPAKNTSVIRGDAYSFFFQSSAPVGHSLTHAPQSTQ